MEIDSKRMIRTDSSKRMRGSLIKKHQWEGLQINTREDSPHHAAHIETRATRRFQKTFTNIKEMIILT